MAREEAKLRSHSEIHSQLTASLFLLLVPLYIKKMFPKCVPRNSDVPWSFGKVKHVLFYLSLFIL